MKSEEKTKKERERKQNSGKFFRGKRIKNEINIMICVNQYLTATTTTKKAYTFFTVLMYSLQSQENANQIRNL